MDNPGVEDYQPFLNKGQTQDNLIRFVVLLIEGQSLNLSQLSQSVKYELLFQFPSFEACLSSKRGIDKLIQCFAKRKCYGNTISASFFLSDLAPDSLWCWEVQLAHMLEPFSIQNIKEVRQKRKVVG